VRAICAWCTDGEGTVESEAVAVRSHGLCAPCLAARLDALPVPAAHVDGAPVANAPDAG